jgi:thiol-disulfide isomerase/thioredoxin
VSTSTHVRYGIATVIAVLVLVLSGCSGGTGGAAGSGLVQSDPGVTRIDPADRRPAPVAEGTDLEGQPLSSADFGGKVVVLNVWGSWCAPCRKEAPDLVAAQSKTADRAQFVGINTRDLDRAPALAFQRGFTINYPSIFDPSGAELLKFTDLPPGMIPSTLVIDRDGRVAARVIGPISSASLVGLIDDVAAGK